MHIPAPPPQFADDQLQIQNPAGTFIYTVQGAAIVANRVVNLPVLTGDDTLVFEAHTATLTGKTLTTPTITTPTIAATEWANANHAHAAANSGGQVGAGDLSGATLAAGVTASSLTSVGTLTALTMGGNIDLQSTHSIVNIGDAESEWTATGLTAVGSSVSTFIRQNAATSSVAIAFVIKADTTGDMADGYGGGVRLQIRDSADVDNSVAEIRWVRDGADNSGELSFHTYSGDSITEWMTIGASGLVTALGDLRASSGIRIGANSGDNEIDDASQGAASTQLFIGNESIDTTASDVRLKTGWSAPNGLAREHLGVLAAHLREYDYVHKPGRFVGFGAQHLDEVLPQYVVRGAGVSHWSVEYKYMVGPLIWGWQQHDDRLAELADELATVRTQLAEGT